MLWKINKLPEVANIDQRFFAWIQWQRRILVRWEYHAPRASMVNC
jgi:hypothetical protein